MNGDTHLAVDSALGAPGGAGNWLGKKSTVDVTGKR